MGTVCAGTVPLLYFGVTTLALLFLRITETKEPSYSSEDATSEPVMQPMRFDGRRDDADVPLGDYTTRRLDRVPSLCERCRCVHTTPANFRLLLVNATTTRDRVPSPPPVHQLQQQQQQQQQQLQQQQQQPDRLSMWNTFKRALTDLRRRVQRFLNLPSRRH